MIAPLALCFLAVTFPVRADDLLDRLGHFAAPPVTLLDDSVAEVERVAMARVLGRRCRKSKSALGQLHRVLGEAPEGPLLTAALLGIAECGAPASLGPLAELLERFRPPPAEALSALASLPGPGPSELLVQAWPRLGRAATSALRMAGERAIPALTAALAGPNHLDAIGLLGELPDQTARAALLASLSRSRDGEQQRALLAALRSHPGLPAPAVLPFLSPRKPGLRLAALAALASAAPLVSPARPESARAEAARALLSPLLSAADPRVRAGASVAWLQLGLPGGADVLARALDDADLGVRARARMRMLSRPEPAFVPLLTARLARAARPESLAMALARLPAGLQELVAFARERPESLPLWAPALAFAQRDHGQHGHGQHDREVYALLRSHLRAGPRRAALLALARDPAIEPELVQGLSDPRPGVRALSAQSLAWLGQAQSATRSALQRALAHEADPHACAAHVRAARALAIAPPADAWRAWDLTQPVCGPERVRWLAAAESACRDRRYREQLRVWLRPGAGALDARVAAVAALQRCADYALPSLIAALDDPAEPVALSAMATLARWTTETAPRRVSVRARRALQRVARTASRAPIRRAAAAALTGKDRALPSGAHLWLRLPPTRSAPAMALIAPGVWHTLLTFPLDEHASSSDHSVSRELIAPDLLSGQVEVRVLNELPLEPERVP